MRTYFLLFFLFQFSFLVAQESLRPLPEAVSNNAVTVATVDGEIFIYTFSGIDETKRWDGIHKRAYRLNFNTEVWEQIDDLPSGTGRIAAGASTIKNKIYIMGGYEVFSNGNERSLDEVHIYDPETNTYLPDGQPIPVPIDDHVQAVYKDSLIFLVTGWSQTTNVGNVQIYDPSRDEWQEGTPVPAGTKYKAFGASGTILGDTLYYLGGAKSSAGFGGSTFFRKGYINPDDPTQIEWMASPSPVGIVYRAACASFDEEVLWFGGSDETYNYNGIAYNGSGGVEQRREIISFRPEDGIFDVPAQSNDVPMDLRGIASLGDEFLSQGQFVTVGGMIENQTVTNEVRVHQLFIVDTENIDRQRVSIFPNPTDDLISIKMEGQFEASLFDAFGRKLISRKGTEKIEIDLSRLSANVYFLEIENQEGGQMIQKVIKN